MNFRRMIMFAFLYIPYGFRKITRTGVFGHYRAVYIDGPIPADGNPLKAALIKHHVKQFNEASCSVASVVSVINAIRDVYKGAPPPISQMDILEAVRTIHWKERMSDKGYKGRRGLPLITFGEVVISSLNTYKISHKYVEIVQAQKNTDQSEKIKRILWDRLNNYEKKGEGLIIAHFDQGAYVPGLNIPHISPVGGFDDKTGKVTILDVDITQERPYMIDFDTFYKGLSSDYNPLFRRFGFGNGGYVYIQLC